MLANPPIAARMSAIAPMEFVSQENMNLTALGRRSGKWEKSNGKTLSSLIAVTISMDP